MSVVSGFHLHKTIVVIPLGHRSILMTAIFWNNHLNYDTSKNKKKSSFKTLQFPDKFGQTWANYPFEIAAACFKILTLSSLWLDVLLHPWPRSTPRTKLQIFPAAQEKINERTATLASLEGQNSWIQYCDPKAIWFCEYLCCQNPLQRRSDLHTYFAGEGVWEYYLGLIFFSICGFLH